MNDDPGLEVELVRGGGGVFDVSVDGKVLFSKHKEGRFPEPGEILSILRARGEKVESASHLSDREATSVERGGPCTTDCCSAAAGKI